MNMLTSIRRITGACLLAALTLCLLAGCASAPTQPARWSIVGGERATAAAGGLPPGLQIRVTSAPWINQTGFLYSLDYQAGRTVESYAQNQWVDRPPILVEDLMRLAYASGQAPPSVAADPGASVQHAAALSVRLVDFSQHFRSPGVSEARIAAVVTVSEVNPGRVRSAVIEASAPAPSADAAGGAQAFGDASDRLIEQIFNWVAKR